MSKFPVVFGLAFLGLHPSDSGASVHLAMALSRMPRRDVEMMFLAALPQMMHLPRHRVLQSSAAAEFVRRPLGVAIGMQRLSAAVFQMVLVFGRGPEMTLRLLEVMMHRKLLSEHETSALLAVLRRKLQKGLPMLQYALQQWMSAQIGIELGHSGLQGFPVEAFHRRLEVVNIRLKMILLRMFGRHRRIAGHGCRDELQ